jgi:hypothetical protein
MPKSAIVRLKPNRMLLSVIVGLGAAAVGGLIFGIAVSAIGFFSIIFAFFLGYGIGEAVSWASGRYHSNGLAAWAAVCAVIGASSRLVIIGVSDYGLTTVALDFFVSSYGFWKFIWMAAAAYGAWQRNS